MSKTYVSQQFFNHRHKIYQKNRFFVYWTKKVVFLLKSEAEKCVLCKRFRDFFTPKDSISFKTGFWWFYPFLMEKYRQKKNLAYFCNFKPDVFYFRALGHIGAKLRGGHIWPPPCTNRLAKYFGTDRVKVRSN